MTEPIRLMGDRWAEERPERSIKTQGWRLWESAKERKVYAEFYRPPLPETQVALRNNAFVRDEVTPWETSGYAPVMNPDNHYKQWTPEDDNLLKAELIEPRLPLTTKNVMPIADELGRSPISVKQRAWKIRRGHPLWETKILRTGGIE